MSTRFLRRTARRVALATTLATCAAALSAPAASHGAFHFIKVSEIGNPVGFADDFIELQLYAGGQQFVSTHHVRIFDAAGAVQGDYEVPTNLGNGDSQRTFTVGNSTASDYNYGGVTVSGAGGAVCWNELGAPGPFGGIDCVSWGSYAPGVEPLSSPAGTNAPAIPDGQSLRRKIDRGCATLLEAGDDTNNSSADFVLGAPTPRNNSVVPTEKPCNTGSPNPPGGKKKAKKKCKKKKKKKGKKGYASAAAKKKKCKKKKKKKK
jgi:hypothetical protein